MTVTIDLLHHRGEVCYVLYYEQNTLLQQQLDSLSFLCYSATLHCYYVYAKKWSLKETTAILKATGISVQYGNILSKRHQDVTTIPSVPGARLLKEYLSYLAGLRLSPSTIQAYALFVKNFIIFIAHKPIHELTNTDVRLFVEAEVKKHHYSISSHRQMISGLKHFATLHLESGLVPDDLKRPSSSKYLPTVLSKEEVIDILRVTKNLKHRTALALLYSSGLRIGELIALELRRIDIDRRQLFVKNSKNRRDRVVILAESFIPLFRNYYATYRPRKYFIENPNGGMYNPGSIRNFLRRSCKAAGISKRVTPHTLRHSYATHMIENGVGLRYVQDLLGHAKPETTMIYTHVAKKDLLHIQSPLDSALQSLAPPDKSTPKFPLSENIIR